MKYLDYFSKQFELAQGMTGVSVTGAASGNNTIVAAPGAGKHLAVAYLKAQRTAGNTAATTVLVKADAGGTPFHTLVLDNDIPGEVCWDAVNELQIRVLPENTALVANLSAANSITFTVRYFVLD